MKRWLLAALAVVGFLLMLYSCALPGVLPAGLSGDGLAGTYTVNGVDPTGAEYSGTAVLAVAAGGSDGPGSDDVGVDGRADGAGRHDGGSDHEGTTSYDIQWIVTGGIQQGTGVLVGNELVVAWSSLESVEASRGTGRYLVGDDGHLVGNRLVDGLDEPGTEELVPEP